MPARPNTDQPHGAAAELARELFAPLAAITVKRMFGGAGIYGDGLFFALIHDGEIYLKADAESEPLFATAGSQPFLYHNVKREKPVKLGYWTLPSEALDDPEAALTWGNRALATARAAAQSGKSRKPRKKSTALPTLRVKRP